MIPEIPNYLSVFTYEVHHHKRCEADNLGPPQDSISLEDCKHACAFDNNCVALVWSFLETGTVCQFKEDDCAPPLINEMGLTVYIKRAN